MELGPSIAPCDTAPTDGGALIKRPGAGENVCGPRPARRLRPAFCVLASDSSGCGCHNQDQRVGGSGLV
jgi:hypothetical protein